jgi:hypothetical protein
MSSGKKTLVYNTQERAISPDANRAQAFNAKDDAEIWRYLLDVTGDDDVNAGVIAEHAVLESPLRAAIFNGLLVKPVIASLNILIDPGVMYAIAPDTDPDASNYKYIRDQGVVVVGALTIGPGGGGGTRIDVIECSINPTNLTVNDNRDIFDPVSGLFTASTVTKETQAQLQYRVRAGTPGAGFPGTAAGWLPLCVATISITALTTDDIEFWDVRPLVSDRVFQPSALTQLKPRINDRTMINATTLATVTGYIDATYDGYRIGGRLRSGSLTVDADSIDASVPANQEPGIVFTASRPWYLYLLFPHNLPRWVRYTATAPKVPRNPKGLPVVSMIAPNSDGVPSAGILPPAVTGLISSTTNGVAVASGTTTVGGLQAGFFGDNNSGFIHSVTVLNGEPLERARTSITNVGNNVDVTWTLTSGTDFPANARALYVEPRADWNGTTAPLSEFIFQVFAPNGGGLVHQRVVTSLINTGALTGSVNTHALRFCEWVQIPTLYPAVAGYTIQVRATLAFTSSPAAGAESGTSAIRILGYKL